METVGQRELLEELRVTEEELRAQNDELAETRFFAVQEHALHRSLFDHAPIPYIVTDPNGVIQDTNHAAAKLLRTATSIPVSCSVCHAAQDLPEKNRRL